ncbi:MAG: 3-phosphoshikimate 1-carboxyvinyltransferase [Clostridiales bacterium]|nr:3-phosphoshikimate 1-carboxyvinyltransferase [Clostridiales bacterium]
MLKTINPGARTGCVHVPSSKSMAHRQLVISALGEKPSHLSLNGISDDIRATAECLNALGARITQHSTSFDVEPIQAANIPDHIVLYPKESGTTLRFMLPLIGVLGVNATVCPEGRLMNRPIRELTDELSRHGMRLDFEKNKIRASGKLQPGDYILPGNVSSQYISALLLSLPRLEGDSRVSVIGKAESAAYVSMTLSALRTAGITITEQSPSFLIHGPQRYMPPASAAVEGDWSNAAFFLCMGALSNKGITVKGLDLASVQGDRQILAIISWMGGSVTECEAWITVKKDKLDPIDLDASQIPDLVPAVSVLMALADGESRFTNAGRLRLKESDRLENTCSFLNAIGASARISGDDIVISGKASLSGGEADACNDHRIAMALTLAACRCRNPVTIIGAEAVNKSFPGFFKQFDSLEEE